MAAPRSSPIAASVTTKINNVTRFARQCPGMENFMALTQLLSSGSTEGGLDGPSTLLLGVFVTLLPKVSCSLTTLPDTCPISSWFPACFLSSWPTSQIWSRSDSQIQNTTLRWSKFSGRAIITQFSLCYIYAIYKFHKTKL